MGELRRFRCQQCLYEKELDTVFNFEVCPVCGGNFFLVDYVPPVDWKVRAETAEAQLKELREAAQLVFNFADYMSWDHSEGFRLMVVPKDLLMRLKSALKGGEE